MSQVLTVKRIEKLRAAGRYRDAETRGLYLQITPGGSRSWILRYELDKRERFMGLGPYSLVSLKHAREKAREAKLLLLDGRDPIEARFAKRDAQRRDRVENVTFKAAARKFYAVHVDTWRNAKVQRQWLSTLEKYASPLLAERPVRAIDTALINEALAERWTKTPTTAARVRERVLRIIKWTSEGMPLPASVATRKRRAHPALAYTQLPAFMDLLRQREGVAARALEFLILTATRTGDVLGARWSEIDLHARVWVIPAHRTKQGREHRTPLSDRAVEILRSVPREENNEHVFVGTKRGRGLGDHTLLELTQELRSGITAHGFRASFKTWSDETQHVENAVVEAALGHASGDKTEMAYRRGDMLTKRARLMNAWADYCASKPATILPLREAVR
jgi:integrase